MNQMEMEKKLIEMSDLMKKQSVQIDLLSNALTQANEKLNATQKPKAYYTKRPQKFWTTQDRYVHGKYVRATPEYPAVVLFSDNVKIAVNEQGMPEDQSLVPYTDKAPEAPKTEGLKKPYAEVRRGPQDQTDTGEGRPSDRDPAGR